MALNNGVRIRDTNNRAGGTWKSAKSKNTDTSSGQSNVPSGNTNKINVSKEDTVILTAAHDKHWLNGLRKFERFRMTHGYSARDLFNVMNMRGTKNMTVAQFSEVVVEFLPEVREHEAQALGREVARKQKRSKGFVSAHGLENLLSTVENLSSISALLQDHPIFPEWLTERGDFQSLFAEWNSDNGCPSIYMIERTCSAPPECRRPSDLSVLLKWLKIFNILTQVRPSRLIECARKLKLMHVPQNMAVVTQGEPGDAFYVVLTGSLAVLVDKVTVRPLYSPLLPACDRMHISTITSSASTSGKSKALT